MEYTNPRRTSDTKENIDMGDDIQRIKELCSHSPNGCCEQWIKLLTFFDLNKESMNAEIVQLMYDMSERYRKAWNDSHPNQIITEDEVHPNPRDFL